MNSPTDQAQIRPKKSIWKTLAIGCGVLFSLVAVGLFGLGLWVYFNEVKPAFCTPNKSRGLTFVEPGGFITRLNETKNLAEATGILNDFGKAYGFAFELRNPAPSPQIQSMSALSENDLPSVKILGCLVIEEYSKYPPAWIKKVKLKHIYFAKQIKILNYSRPATYNFLRGSMYYTAERAGENLDDQQYIRHVLHHEFDHYIEGTYFGIEIHPDKIWERFNAPGFKYGGGGITYLDRPNLFAEHTKKGFVTEYATSALEEDKAELYAYLFDTALYKKLLVWTKDDEVLAKKVASYKKFIQSIVPSMNEDYFKRIHNLD